MSTYIKPEDSGIMYLPTLHEIKKKTEKYVHSSSGSIKSSPLDGSTACSLIATSPSNPNSPHIV